MKPQPVLYIFVPTDIGSLNPGKAMAQCSHAANLAVKEIRGSDCGALKKLLSIWEAEGQGFGTTIVLGFSCSIPLEHKKYDGVPPFASGWVNDETYPFVVDNDVADMIPVENETAPRETKGNKVVIFRNKITVGYLFCDRRNPIREKFSHLQLHP